MINVSTQLQNESRRLDKGLLPQERPNGVGAVTFIASCPHGTDAVLHNVKEVLKTVDNAILSGWPLNESAKPKLPDWFVAACANRMSPQQAEQWLKWWKGLSAEDQARAELEKQWALDDWLYWMEPENRQWYWWDAETGKDHTKLRFAVEVSAWPFPWGALRWLFRAAGASAVQPEE
jgi:hypothetical protein